MVIDPARVILAMAMVELLWRGLTYIEILVASGALTNESCIITIDRPLMGKPSKLTPPFPTAVPLEMANKLESESPPSWSKMPLREHDVTVTDELV